MIRKCIIPIEEVESVLKNHVLNNLNIGKRKKPWEKNQVERYIEIRGEKIYAFSDRYKTFFAKGYKCACCGIEGKFFALEKSAEEERYHLNLYAIDDNGKEVLMTKDHIIPKSKGGKNILENYQTMCVKCNVEKGNN